MDVCINSQIQSPLVRTLAQTKGKSASFTLGLADNVPPCSFSKIEIATQNPGETSYNRSYKLKIPQYGYLRDIVLRYTTREAPIKATVAKIAQDLYTETYMSLDDIRVPGTNAAPGGQGGASAPCLSWFNLQNPIALVASDLDLRTANNIRALAPQFNYLLAGSVAAGITTAPNGTTAANLFKSAATPAVVNLNSTPPTLTGAANVPGPYTQMIRLNGTPAMWSAVFKLYHNIYQLAFADQVGAAVAGNTKKYSIAKLIWGQLSSEVREYVRFPLFGTNGIPTTYNQYNATGDISGWTPTKTDFVTDCMLPQYMALTSRAGKVMLVPKIPVLQTDAAGTVIGCKLVPLHLLHPNDLADQSTDLFLTGKLNPNQGNEATNFREFPFNPASTDTEWKPWDWQTEAQYYPGFAANIADRVVLSTHNRPIQTVFPQETFARVQRMPAHERYRYLKMMKPRVSKPGACQGSAPQAGEKIMHFPLLLHSTENPSFNFDTRFVEQLDIDVVINSMDNVFNQSDIVAAGSSDPLSIANYIYAFTDKLFPFYWKIGTAAVGLRASGATDGWSVADNITGTIEALEMTKAVTAQPAAFDIYSSQSVQAYILSLRTAQNVAANYVKVEALLYYHNFHDATAQAIRDSNFKPGEPASILAYNTYAESEMLVKATDLQQTNVINIPITSNNLIMGTYFLIKRRRTNLKYSSKRDHLMQTLPIKQITLTASGQQIYTSTNDELAFTDTWDYDLATGKVGRKYMNSVLVQSRDDVVSGDSFYLYYIPFAFSSDMTYNSGSLAFQTLNNPMLSITIDVGDQATQPFGVVAQDGEWSIRVFHNYWNMLRIDSNTGSITKSLDL